MLYYLDTVIVIYAVEGNPADQQRALTHLAAAIESGCDVFLTNDNQLATFPDITIEVLP